MNKCEYCGGGCRRSVRLVEAAGSGRRFCCVECALAALYPACETCGDALRGEAFDHADGSAYCGPLCAGRAVAAA
jgi:ribonuclease PH